MEDFIKKHGLLYSADLHTILGVDDKSFEFTGRIPFGAHVIDDEVFTECPYESFSIPDSVKKIGARQFENSKALESVKLPSTITELPAYLFAGCEALTKVKMPDSLTAFPEGLFMGCSSLQEIPFRAGITELPENVIANCTGIKNLIIPNSVTKIDSMACAGCTALESVMFPEGIKEIAPDAFEGCVNLHSVRIAGESELFYVSEDDGCLHYKGEGGDVIAVRINTARNDGVGFFKDNVDDEPIEESEDEELEDDDTFFSCEIGASDEEIGIVEMSEDVAREEKNMSDNNVDMMLAEIMGDENERTNSVAEDVSVSESETAALSGAMDVMEDNAQNAGGSVSQDELEQLFAKHEEEVISENAKVVDPEAIDSKTQILLDSVEFSKVLRFEPKGNVPDDNEVYVIAEKTVTGPDGNEDFSEKLIKCCKSFANIHDFKKVIMVKGLPLDNDEFMQFYHYFISRKNVIFACEAESPSKLSEYGKTICEQSNISLDRNELNEQRKNSTIKSNMLIKLVIRDKYE